MEQRKLGINDLKCLLGISERAIDAGIDIFLEKKTSITGNEVLVLSAQEKVNEPMSSYILPKEGKYFIDFVAKGDKLFFEYASMNKEERKNNKFYYLVKAYEELTGLLID
mgnify:CR=1 FL=1|jgi:hypothetical protein